MGVHYAVMATHATPEKILSPKEKRELARLLDALEALAEQQVENGRFARRQVRRVEASAPDTLTPRITGAYARLLAQVRADWEVETTLPTETIRQLNALREREPPHVAQMLSRTSLRRIRIALITHPELLPLLSQAGTGMRAASQPPAPVPAAGEAGKRQR